MASFDKFKTSIASGGNSPTKSQRHILELKGLAGQAAETNASTLRSKIAKEDMKQIFRNYMGPVAALDDDNLQQEIGTYFSRHFDPGANRLRGDYSGNNNRIKERITALQKRTTETLEAINQCKGAVESVTIIDSKSEVSDEALSKDKRSLTELTDELTKMQACALSKTSFATPADRSDIDDITKATTRLLNDLQRISKTYGTLK